MGDEEPARRRTSDCPPGLDVPCSFSGLRFGNGDPTARVEGGRAWRATNTPEGPGSCSVEVRDGQLLARGWGPGADWLVERAPDLVGVHDDPAALVPQHRVLRDLARRFPGLRLGGGLPLVEVLAAVALGQRVTVAEAQQGWRRLVLGLDHPAPGPAGLLLPPTPRELARLPDWDYHRAGIERGRAHVLRCAGRSAKRLAEAAEMPAEDAYRRLTALPGVGPWTAWKTLALATGNPDAVPLGDYHLPHDVAWAFAGEPRGDDARMLELLEPYRGQRWRVIRLLKLGHIGAPRRGSRRATWRSQVERASRRHDRR